MDQLKKQLAVVMEYGFWIGCVVVLAGSSAIWWMSRTAIADANDKQISKIKSDYTTMTSLQGEMSTQPNEESHKEMQKMIEVREGEILDAWIKIYQRQREILTWPTELKQEYIDEFRYAKDKETGEYLKDYDPKTGKPIPGAKKLRLPFESYSDINLEKEPNKDHPYKALTYVLDAYQLYVERVLPGVAAIGKTKWTADFDAAAGGMSLGEGMDGGDRGGGGGGAAGSGGTISITGDDERPVVEWSTSSQERVLNDLFPWRGKRPTTLDVYYSQENLWILKQLLAIVSEVNEGARLPFEAKIRAINDIRIGKSVEFGAGAIAKPGTGAAAGGAMDMGFGGVQGVDGLGGNDMGFTMSGPMTDGFSPPKLDPGDKRYVDTALKPISASDLKSKLTSKQPADAQIAVAKRVPVMMSLNIDQRYVPTLLAACGSAPLMVEVRQTRILDGDAGGSDMGGGGAGREEGQDEGMMMQGGLGGDSSPAPEEEEFPIEKTVEVYGLIYIYNPPNSEGLGVKQVTEENLKEAVDAQTAPAEQTPPENKDVLPAPPAAGPANPDAGNPDAGNPDAPAPDAANPVPPVADPAAPVAANNP